MPCDNLELENNNVQNLKIQLCGRLLEDDHFSNIERYLPPGWVKDHCACINNEEYECKYTMDNVQFHNDRLEIVINVNGYASEDIRCDITPGVIEVVAQRPGNSQTSPEGITQCDNMCMKLTYKLPQRININEAVCYLSADGFLAIMAPWI